MEDREEVGVESNKIVEEIIIWASLEAEVMLESRDYYFHDL